MPRRPRGSQIRRGLRSTELKSLCADHTACAPRLRDMQHAGPGWYLDGSYAPVHRAAREGVEASQREVLEVAGWLNSRQPCEPADGVLWSAGVEDGRCDGVPISPSRPVAATATTPGAINRRCRARTPRCSERPAAAPQRMPRPRDWRAPRRSCGSCLAARARRQECCHWRPRAPRRRRISAREQPTFRASASETFPRHHIRSSVTWTGRPDGRFPNPAAILRRS